ncbi:hypothetical protein F511_17359 [Dorcoceras hygrometricum]|uniref:Uncharacterized protein n=1 Tax=Dorcoceras hygrometricum TaxID=472368 RepID=A0A2Z7AZT7_9LAMI|nr:hypothetical protein F511_17359 [Dorcoceras hygrometricum]
MLYANWDTLSTTWGTTSWIKATPSCESWKTCTTRRQQHNSSRGTSGSNPSTESNKYSKRKSVDKYADAMLEIEVQPNAESRGISKQQLDSWITQQLERNNGKTVVTESANSPSKEMGDGSYPHASSFKVYGSYPLVLKPSILAQNLKFQNRSKPGPASHTGPKTSRAARDRPEPNPRRIQTSRHDIAGAAAGRRPPHEKSHGSRARRRAKRDARPRARSGAQRTSASQQWRTSCAIVANQRVARAALPATSDARPAAQHTHGRARRSARGGAHHRPNAARQARRSLAQRSGQQARSGARRIGHDARQARKLGRRSRDKSAASARPARAMALGVAPPRAAASGDCGSLRQSGPRLDPRLLRQAALEALTRSARTDSPRRVGRKRISGDNGRRRTAGGGGGSWRGEEGRLAL